MIGNHPAFPLPIIGDPSGEIKTSYRDDRTGTTKREQAAIAAMQGLLAAGYHTLYTYPVPEVCRIAVEYADGLAEQLKK